MTFFDDIKSKHLSNYVLVTIGDPDDPIHRISTQKVRLGEDYYKPILLNIPAISESLDVENRKYKISSLRLSISDYKEDGVRFSDSLNQLMNREVNIWYASQSCKTLEECYLAGTFIVRSFTQDEDKVGLNCEDLSQDKLHKDLPLAELDDGDNIPNRYKNKPIPMVFGFVDRSPCVIKEDLDLENGKYIIKGDDIGVNSNGLFILRDENYLFFPFMDDSLSEHYGLSSNRQYFESPVSGGSNVEFIMNNLILDTEITEYKSLIDIDLGLVSLIDKPIKKILIKESFIVDNDLAPDISYSYPANDFGETFNLASGGTFTFAFSDFSSTSYQEVHQFKSLIDHITEVEGVGNIGDVKPYYGIDYNLEITDIDTTDANVETSIFFSMKTSDSSDNMYRAYHPLEGGGVSDAESGAFPFVNFEDNWKSISNINQYNQLKLSLYAFPRIVGVIAGINSSNATLNINSIIRKIDYIIDKIHTSLFYVEATGRGGEEPTLQQIYSIILGADVLGFEGILNQDGFSMGTDSNNNPTDSYDFTLDKKINSKKLLEEISASSGLFPYFKNGDFNVKSIKSFYDGANKTIMGDDILSYKYDRTKIEKVYTKILVKFHYDYGLKDFIKETGYIESIVGITDSYDTDYFGSDFNQELVFESKYIRDETTALNLAEYLFGLYANQHNLITVKLPLNYLVFELGDIVKFDSLIQDRKMFGEDYTKVADRNGQQILPFFFITQIKKNLDSVEVKLYQLHNFSDVLYSDPEEVGEGCTNSEALNYNSNAVTDNGSCILPGILQPPVIVSPLDDAVIPIEFEGDEEIELITDIPRNSTFDENTGVNQNILLSGTVGVGFNGVNPHPPGIIHLYDESGEYDTGELADNNTYLTNTTSGSPLEGVPILIISNTDFLVWLFIGTGNTNLIFNAGDTYSISTFEGGSQNSDWYGTSEFVTLLGGEGNLITQINSFHEGCRLNLGEQPNGTYNVSFDIHKIGSVSNIKVALRNSSSISVESTNITITDSPTQISVTLSSEETFSQLWITGEENIASSDKIIIDNVSIIKQATQTLQNPVLNVIWTPSLNLLLPVGNLDYVPSGIYFIVIHPIDTLDDPSTWYFSDSVVAENNEMSLLIDFANLNIPQNTEIGLMVAAQTDNQIGDNYVFEVIEEQILPTSPYNIVFSWGEIEQGVDTVLVGDITGEGEINVSDIVHMIGYILGATELTAEQISAGDTTGDGNINVIDVVQLVHNILVGD